MFGNEIITEDGHLNRKKLGSIIFQSDEKRQQLNQLLNPFIRSEIVAQIEEKKKLASLVIVDIPLLFEGHYEQYMTQVAVVYIPEVLQLQRLMKRDHLNEEDALKRIHSQLDIEEKKKRADIVFDNQGSQEKTREQVMAWLSKFK
ncbi:dephospho-CoA kinase [Enterococcus phoeniculicola]|nr:dephospho-CoA kinase [Enterococcus phoeniculicola]